MVRGSCTISLHTREKPAMETKTPEPGKPGSAKAELRKRISSAREALSSEDAAGRSAQIRRRVLEVPEVRAATSIFAYVSCGKEVDTPGLISDLLASGKTVLVPLITGDGIMEAHRIEGLGDLGPGKYGIPAPLAANPFQGTPDVTICPGVAFGPGGDRLGRGKGFYDRFLAAHPGTFAIGLAFAFQVVDGVPATPEDRKVDLIVMEDVSVRPRA
jgi:5,10-methenyltetrahydrofolate synthetase